MTLVIILGVTFVWFFQLDKTISERLKAKKFTSPVEYYSNPEKVFKGQKIKEDHILQILNRLNYRQRKPKQAISPGDYVRWNADLCQEKLQREFIRDTEHCLAFKRLGILDELDTKIHVIAFGANDIVYEVYSGNPPQPKTVIELEPEMFAQYYGDKPIWRRVIDLGETPALCLNGLLAIEDSQFLEHQGVSATGIFRALIRNIRSGRIAQGGSTITQQLVKNYFLTSERTIKRKVTEMAMAFLLENRATKDEILETYLNVIYMGQLGPFEIRGYGAASKYYFGIPIEDLNLPQCALLAAIVNSPGLYNPFRHPERAKSRRKKVLDRMVELEIISQFDARSAYEAPLPKSSKFALREPAPYFVEAVRAQVSELGVNTENGLKIFTTLNIQAQKAAQKAVTSGIEKLESWYKSLKKKKEEGKELQGALISADPTTGFVEALVGGKRFKLSQFNRATQSKRQIGSIIKPVVYLSALETVTDNGRPFDPFTLLDDSRFTVEYEGQSWSPRNYEGKHYDMVPMFFALKSSLNSATARLGLKAGLDEVVETAHALGLRNSKIQALPSLTLGAVELSPKEVLQVYTTISRMGLHTPLTLIRRLETFDGDVVYRHVVDPLPVVDPQATAVLVGMMKQVIENGTGALARKLGFTHPAAGKTGTTSDTKDAWFSGFTPLHTTTVWVGYDDNTPHGLTGATGALPIWTEYMKAYASQFPPIDFTLPEGVEKRSVDIATQVALGIPDDPKKPIESIELIFKTQDY